MCQAYTIYMRVLFCFVLWDRVVIHLNIVEQSRFKNPNKYNTKMRTLVCFAQTPQLG